MDNCYKLNTVFTKKDFNFSCIYKLTSPSGKIYIGQTKCFNDRMKRYRGGFFNPYMKKSVDKYGLESIMVEILEKNIPLENLDKREQFYLDTLQPFDENGYNICKEASTTRGRKRPKEELVGISEYRKTRVGELNSFYGKKHSEETKQKQREYKLGKKQSKETIQKQIDSRKGILDKCVQQLDKDTLEVICVFNSISEASEVTNTCSSSISNIVNNKEIIKRGKKYKRKSAGGYMWKFCE